MLIWVDVCRTMSSVPCTVPGGTPLARVLVRRMVSVRASPAELGGGAHKHRGRPRLDKDRLPGYLLGCLPEGLELVEPLVQTRTIPTSLELHT